MWILLVLAAPPCQQTNPEFDGAQGTGSASGTSSTTTPGTTDGGSADGSTTVGATMGATGSTGQPPNTTGEASSSGSTGGESSGTTGCMLMMCGDLCVDIQTDNDHCGECDNGCNPVQQCVDGMCMMM